MIRYCAPETRFDSDAKSLYAKAKGFAQLDLNGQGNLYKTYCGGV